MTILTYVGFLPIFMMSGRRPWRFAALTQVTEIIHRKSDVRKKGKTRGWEMMLSY
jgi:hypothetical protein